jgi:hypothetical protein
MTARNDSVAGGRFIRPQAQSESGLVRAEGGGPRGNHGFPRASAAGRINAPRPALVEASPVGVPVRVNREGVALVREEWRVVDRWWTDEPVDRRYFEVVLESGRNVCVYRDGERRCWFVQRA